MVKSMNISKSFISDVAKSMEKYGMGAGGVVIIEQHYDEENDVATISKTPTEIYELIKKGSVVFLAGQDGSPEFLGLVQVMSGYCVEFVGDRRFDANGKSI